MTNCAPCGRLFLLLFLIFSFTGCSQFMRGPVSEEKDPHFLEGKKRNSGMDWDGAIQSFERALQSNPTNAAAHFELGLLFDQRKNDYGAAIYHYQRHLKLRPSSPMAEMANTYIIACKRELAKSVSYTVVPRDLQRELERFDQTNSLLRQQISALQNELTRRPQYITNYVTNLVKMPQFDGRSARLTAPATIVDPDPAPLAPLTPAPQMRAQNPAPRRAETAPRNSPTKPSSGRIHQVRPGDTLDVIARRYGVSVAALKAANPSARNGARSGQQLVIP